MTLNCKADAYSNPKHAALLPWCTSTARYKVPTSLARTNDKMAFRPAIRTQRSFYQVLTESVLVSAYSRRDLTNKGTFSYTMHLNGQAPLQSRGVGLHWIFLLHRVPCMNVSLGKFRASLLGCHLTIKSATSADLRLGSLIVFSRLCFDLRVEA